MSFEAASLAKMGPLITKLAEAFAAPAKGVASRAKERVEVRLQRGFARFLEENLKRFSSVKTIISSATPIPFLTLYVNLYVQNDKSVARDDDFLAGISRLKNVFFTASAGAGKSMLMRYLYLRFLEVQTDRLPIFVELRELNEHPSRSIQEHIQLKISDYIDGFSELQLKYALELGKVVLFLDGLDEVDHDQRKQREFQINELVARYKKLWTFVSCRPPETLASWQAFHVFEIEPFSKAQVERLIQNIPYDATAKETFRRKLESGLYESHRQFLTNPLLTIMMLVTLEQFAEVPAKIHLFYEYAFEALFGRHDATKAGFQRKRHTTLAMDDFKRLFSYFSMITYAKQARAFSVDQTLEFIQQAIVSSQISVDKSDFKLDLTECTCMLVRDGLDYTFSHRSFQEYFAAYFLSRVKADEFATIVPRLIDRAVDDNVIPMVAEMNQERFEESWALPTLSKLYNRVRNIDPRKNCVAFDAAAFERWPFVWASDSTEEEPAQAMIHFDNGSEDDEAKERDAINSRYVLYRMYGVFDAINEGVEERSTSDTEIVRRIAKGELLGNDPRFEAWRHATATDGHLEYPPVRLEEDDHSWISQSRWGKVLAVEADLLPKLLSEVSDRVSSRRNGLAAIFQ